MYILKGENDIYNPVKQVLENRGLTDDIFFVNESDIEDYMNYDNIIEACEKILWHIDNNNYLLIVADADSDGACSCAVIYNYLKEEFPNANIEITIHTSKQHGLSDDIVVPYHINCIIMPDASSSDYEQHKYYKEKGVDVICIDHHESEKYSESAIVVNNQLSIKVKNKTLCGTGVAYKVLKCFDDMLYIDKADKYLDLVGMANIADVMDLSNHETRYLTFKGLKSINNLFLKALCEVNAFDLDGKMNAEKIGFSIAPKINATIRAGKQDEKMQMYKAFTSNNYEHCLEVANMCKKIKSRQDSAVKTGLNKIMMILRYTEGDKVVIADATKLGSAYSGLVATKIADQYKVPVLLYRNLDDGTVAGSARGFDNITTCFKSDLEKSELATGIGHENAFGWQCKKEDLPQLKEYINELYKEKEVVGSKCYEVDFELYPYEIDYDFVEQLSELENEWSKGFEKALIAIKDVDLELDQDNIKGRLNIVFDVAGIKCVKRFSSNELKARLINKRVLCDLICSVEVDSYSGEPCFVVTDFIYKQ